MLVRPLPTLDSVGPLGALSGSLGGTQWVPWGHSLGKFSLIWGEELPPGSPSLERGRKAWVFTELTATPSQTPNGR